MREKSSHFSSVKLLGREPRRQRSEDMYLLTQTKPLQSSMLNFVEKYKKNLPPAWPQLTR